MTEPKITRSNVIVVKSVEHNNYGDLVFTDEGGVDYKVGIKRAKYFEDVIIVNRAVQLNFAEAYNKEYIYYAKPVEGELPPPQKPELLPKDREEVEQARAEVRQEAPPPAPQAVGMITKELGDMMRAKLLTPIFGKEIANELTKWYRGQTLGITRIPFDSDKLPKFE